jgi:hypothetical protein
MTADPEVDFLPITSDTIIREKILQTLSVYPRISPTMLQVGIGTSITPRMWHPILDQLIEEKIVKRETRQSPNNVTGRDQTYTIISLVDVK